MKNPCWHRVSTQIFYDLQPYLPQILSYAALGKRSKMILGINLSEGTKSFFIWATIGVIQLLPSLTYIPPRLAGQTSHYDLKLWSADSATTRWVLCLQRNYNVRKGEPEQPPYPGVIIEEMLDSASMQGDPAVGGQVALVDQRHEVI